MKKQISVQDRLLENSIFIIGSVYSVKGREIVVKVKKDKNLPHLFFNGKLVRNVSVGLSNYVKIVKGFTEIICKVEGEYLEEDRYEINKNYKNEKNKSNRYLNVSVFGFYDDDYEFQYGIKEMPLIGSECRLLSKEEFEALHKLSNGKELAINLGTLIDEETQSINISVKNLFAGHIGIFGNTGSGKSNTLAKMYSELFKLEDLGGNFKNKSKFVFIDFNGEYSKASNDKILTEEKDIYKLRTQGNDGDRYPILKTEIEKLEILSILLDATEKTQQPFLHRAIGSDWYDTENSLCRKEIRSIEDGLRLILGIKNSEFNVPFLKKYVNDFSQLGFKILNHGKSLDNFRYHGGNCTFYYQEEDGSSIFSDRDIARFFGEDGIFNVTIAEDFRLKDLQAIQFKILHQYYWEVLYGYINQEHIGPLMGRLEKRFHMLGRIFDVTTTLEEEDRKNVEVVDLKNVNAEMKKIAPLLICKTNYEIQRTKRDLARDNSLHIIIDEAHNILSEYSSIESDFWKDYRLQTFEEIIKEGRKFGVFLTIASQRPSDISPTIISQLHNYFIHKLMNENDLRAINKAVSYLDKLSFDSISNLATGCCFIAGQLTKFPLSVKVKLLDEPMRPQSETTDLNKLWKSTSSQN